MPLESIKTRCISCTKKKHVYHSCVPIILLPKIIFYISAFWVCILHTKEWIILVYQSFFYLKFLFLYFSILSLHPSYKYYASNFRGGECMKTSLPLWLPLGRFFFFFSSIQYRSGSKHCILKIIQSVVQWFTEKINHYTTDGPVPYFSGGCDICYRGCAHCISDNGPGNNLDCKKPVGFPAGRN